MPVCRETLFDRLQALEPGPLSSTRAPRSSQQEVLPSFLIQEPRRRQWSSFFEESRQPLVEQKQKALRSRAKSGRVEQLSVWTKNESKTALAISKRANRVAFGALLFTILGVAVDAAANLVTILTTKRDMAEVEDEAAQVFAQSRQDRREPFAAGDVESGPTGSGLRLMSPSFDSTAWAPEQHVYGLLPLLMCREVIREELTLPPPDDRLKAVDSKHCEAQIFKPPRKDPSKEEEEDDDACSYISEGEPRERSELVSWGKSHRGSWWRVRSNLREELIVRAGVSLSSVEIGRSVAGDVFQQKGKPRMLLEKRGEGCIRMPIQPTGWITADASRAGGPQYLIRIHSPQWKAVYDAGGQDILVRASVELDSEVVATLSCGDIVEQDGPVTTVHWGIVRMPIVVKSG